MRISLFGLGYVGCVTAACLAKEGYSVLGVDVSQAKIDMINEGKSPIVEEGLEENIQRGLKSKLLRGTTDPYEGVLNSEISMVCVGTPSMPNGSLDLSAIKEVTRQIGEGLKRKGTYHCVVFRSTVLPGTTRGLAVPILNEVSGLQAHKDFDVCFNPEFLREGSSIKDFYNPPFTVIGAETERGAETLSSLYSSIKAPIKNTNYEVAEMLKYSCNIFHAVKVAFANEIGVLCKESGIDSHSVMKLLTMDTKLNVSSAYLMPGFAFGGSCLPKDMRALLHFAKTKDLHIPFLESVFPSNKVHIQRAIDKILSKGIKKVGILGLSFKEGTDDLRESPMVTLVETLIGKGCHIKIYDSDVLVAKIFGANKKYIEKEIPHISSLMCQKIEEVTEESDIIVIGKREKGFKHSLESHLGKKPIFDLVRLFPNPLPSAEGYEGVCW
jgi:GDP-mannose 6-dehydrogenase